jgi:zinc protease
MVDIENWKLEDLKRHFEMGYSPSNATMVVSGDVTPEEIIKLAEKYIEPIQSHAPPPPVTTREPEQLGERRVTVRKFAQLPLLMIGYHAVDAKNPDYYALQVLQTILFSGQSSRMYQRLVDKDQIALFVGGGLGPSFDPALFTITTQPKANTQPETVEKAIYEEFDKVKTQAVTDQELEKAKNILLASFYRSLKTISGKAITLGSYEIFFGDYRKLFTVADDYARVTKADLQRVAQKYFTDKNRTVATLAPEKAEEGKKATSSGQ